MASSSTLSNISALLKYLKFSGIPVLHMKKIKVYVIDPELLKLLV